MSERQTSIFDLVSQPDLDKVAAAVEDAMRDMSDAAQLALINSDVDGFRKSVSATVRGALSLDIYDMLLKAWSGWKGVQKLISRDGPMDGDLRSVPIVKHDLKARYEPELELRIEAQGAPVFTLRTKITVDTKLTVGGVSVGVIDREIVAVSAVTVTPEVAVAVRGLKITGAKFKTIEFAELYRAEPG